MITVTLTGPAPDSLRGGCIALGNFDGLHDGHRAVIEAARGLTSTDVPLLVGTFDPTPRDLFAPDSPPSRIHTPRQRERTLEGLGVDGCILIPFDRALSQLSDEEFFDRILIDQLNVCGVAVGFDFRFGRGRMGDAARLTELGHSRGVDVRIVDEVTDEGGKLSSTRIRAAIASGDMVGAERILGDWWTVDSDVEDGEKRGRTLGMPTANMHLGNLIQPRLGVYAVWSRVADGGDWAPGVASFGRTPTTGLRDPLLEVHVIDFDGDLYGKRLEVAFVEFLRPEIRFDSLDDLVAQMQQDKADAAGILRNARRPM